MGAAAEDGGMTEFLAMGGYAFYVWGSYGVTALCIVLEVFFLNRKAKP
jgi:heme exporter protein D